ncbi:MAG TPA: DUF4388 domain-containing protein [Acidimicrobiia bacterium]
MSLSGTFDVFSLPEVLRMLATAGKSGTLTVEAAGRSARVDLYEGECCGAGHGAADEALVATHTAAALHACLLDVAFETRGAVDGSFRFAGDEHPRPRPAACAAIEPVLDELDQLEREWQDISTVVPSTDAVPVLASELPADEITVSGFEWKLLACLDGTTTVRELPGRSGGSLVGVCRALASLVRRGAIDVAPVAPPSPVAEKMPAPVAIAEKAPVAPKAPVATAPTPAPAPVPQPVAEPERVAEDEPVAVAKATPADEKPVDGDRGAMLRLFSALRE